MSEFAREELRRFASGRPTALTIGNFDGVHRGHQHLVRFLIVRAHALNLAAGVVTLYPDPARVLRPQEPAQYLTSLEERLELLHGLALDFVVPLTFTSELAELSPRSFITLLREQLDMRMLLMGPDNAFGRNREATPAAVTALGQEMGFSVEVLPGPLGDPDLTISSTSIRAALAAGDVETVAKQLGRPYSLRGPVVKGDRLGRTFGFPTANIGVTADRALPAFGIYATWAYVGEARYPSATSIGIRPTVGGTNVTVETYIIDFEGDLYDEILRIELVTRMRPEVKFSSVEAMQDQIARDVAQARRILRD
jgi:riboflavin kinase/FMN adenylyltransferase